MHFDELGADWGFISDNFVVIEGDKKRVAHFIKNMHAAKVETERKMRFEIEHKI